MPQLTVENGSPADLKDFERAAPLTFPNATLMGDSMTGNVYVVENGMRRHITSEKVFIGLGYKWDNVVWVNQFVIDIHDLGESIYLRSNEVATTPPAAPETSKENSANPETTSPKTITTGTVEENVLVFTPPANQSLPIDFPETGKMIRTPADATTFVGPQFSTELDAYLIGSSDGKTIYAGKNIDVMRPMASLTKPMTSYRLFAEGLDVNRASVFKRNKHTAAYHRYRIVEGEGVRNEDLLKSMLVRSRNTPARMLVGAVVDTESTFISRMNAQAANWGLDNTVFSDSYGYDLGNQTTARDYHRLFKKILDHKQTKSILGTSSYA